MNREDEFIVELEENISTGELMLPVPEAILSTFGWYEGTELELTLDGDSIVIKESNHDYWVLPHLCQRNMCES